MIFGMFDVCVNEKIIATATSDDDDSYSYPSFEYIHTLFPSFIHDAADLIDGH